MSLRVGAPTGSRVVTIYTSGTIEYAFAHLKAPFDDLNRRAELRQRFEAIDGLTFPNAAEAALPNRPLSLLLDPVKLQQFFDVVDWWASETESHLAQA